MSSNGSFHFLFFNYRSCRSPKLERAARILLRPADVCILRVASGPNALTGCHVARGTCGLDQLLRELRGHRRNGNETWELAT